ncbi:hypothetical protein IEQ34_016072 [Dendrobium chrysotoxum]|uniref:EF-hand domain-containing protein n=1 Tax=Dendrobium chrysotoxum TaxID=161865 RepID=A0AAV7GEL0_DENCH|nr:hypothetical protein IEQ34_016072 [Dendrobium chrysotoxum]
MNLFIAYISILVTCPLLFTAIHFFSFFLHHFLKSKSPFTNTLPFLIITKFNTVSKSLFPSEKDEDEADESRRSLITASDAMVVMRRLGLWRGDKYCKDAGVLEGAYRLLEEKEASLEELEEAFAVFDEDCDGVISANELRNVLKRLGFREGIGLEECRGMICNYDLDGDGRIGFKEFKSLLEQAT